MKVASSFQCRHNLKEEINIRHTGKFRFIKNPVFTQPYFLRKISCNLNKKTIINSIMYLNIFQFKFSRINPFKYIFYYLIFYLTYISNHNLI